MAKIIQFPGARTEPVQQEVDDFYAKELSKAFIEDFIDRFGHGLVNELFRNEFDVDEEEFVLRFMYSLEVMKSVLYASKGIDHTLTKSTGTDAREYFEEMDTDE
jgi:hypothetical protein